MKRKLSDLIQEAEHYKKEYDVLRTARWNYFQSIDYVNEKTDPVYLHLQRLETAAFERYEHFISRGVEDCDSNTEMAYRE